MDSEDTSLTTWLTSNPAVFIGGLSLITAGLAAGAAYMMATSSLTSSLRSRSRSEPPPPICSVPFDEQSITFDVRIYGWGEKVCNSVMCYF